MAGHNESVFEGKTLDDAVRMGLDALGLSRAEVMITVLEEGSGGFLGLGARPYKVRVMPRPGGAPREPLAPGERSRGGRGRGGRAGGRGEGRGEASGGRRDGRGEGREKRSQGREGRGERDRGTRQPVMSSGPRGEERAGGRSEAGAGGTSGVDREPGEGGRRRRGRRGGRGRQERSVGVPERVEGGGVAVAPGAAPADTPQDFSAPPEAREPRESRESREPRERRRPEAGERAEGARAETPSLPAAELEARAARATDELLRAMGFEARVSARAEGDDVEVTAEVPEGEDLLTGRKGEVRQALQHLLNLTVNRGEGMRYHVQLEINDFWQRREAELQTLARSMADEAVSRGGEVLTEYLNAQERRVIHVTLREDPRVRTYAIGDGLIKKLAVAPADQPEPAREAD